MYKIILLNQDLWAFGFVVTILGAGGAVAFICAYNVFTIVFLPPVAELLPVTTVLFLWAALVGFDAAEVAPPLIPIVVYCKVIPPTPLVVGFFSSSISAISITLLVGDPAFASGDWILSSVMCFTCLVFYLRVEISTPVDDFPLSVGFLAFLVGPAAGAGSAYAGGVAYGFFQRAGTESWVVLSLISPGAPPLFLLSIQS